jgi:hypothetical protein
MAIDSHRLSILTSREIDDLYGLPRFTEDDRHLYFDLSAAEHEAVDAHIASVAVHLILQLGYFKAKCQFFAYAEGAVLEDIRYVLDRHFPGRDLASIKMPSRPTRLEQQRIILKLFDYRLCDPAAKLDLERKAQRIARLSTQPVYILREMLQHLTHQRIVAPPYTFLQDLVGRVVTAERKRITQLLAQALTPAVENQLDALLQADEGMYRITTLKHEPKDFSYKALRQEVDHRKFFQPLHEFAQAFLATTGLSNESVRYYASLVQFYTVYKLTRMAAATSRLYLLCFAYHRFRQINDNLIEAFIHLVDRYEKQAKLAAEDAGQQAMIEANEHLQAAGQVLNLFVDASIPANTPFASVREQAFSLLQPERFPLVSDYLRNIELDKTAFEWSYYATLSPTFKRNLRHLFADLAFAGRVDDAPLLKAVAFLQDLLRQGKPPRQAKPSAFPTAVIPKGLQRYLFIVTEGNGKAKRLEVDRYEFLVYRLLRNALEAGDVSVQDSTELRRFEDALDQRCALAGQGRRAA